MKTNLSIFKGERIAANLLPVAEISLGRDSDVDINAADKTGEVYSLVCNGKVEPHTDVEFSPMKPWTTFLVLENNGVTVSSEGSRNVTPVAGELFTLNSHVTHWTTGGADARMWCLVFDSAKRSDYGSAKAKFIP